MNRTLEAPETAGVSSQRLERIRPAMQFYVDQRQFAGVSTMIARRGRVIHWEHVGWMDREARRPMTDDVIFRIYSMTKPIICSALMILYEEGRFQLVDPVAKFIPAFGKVRVLAGGPADKLREVDPIRPMTIRDLMTHQSGLTYDFLDDSPVGALYRQAHLLSDVSRSLEEMVSELARLPLAYQPGTRWHYSLGIDVAAHLIEVIAEKPLADFLHERIFAPLGMVDTGFSVPTEKVERVAAVYGLPDLMSPDMSFVKLNAAWERGEIGRIDVSQTYSTTPSPNYARGGHGLFSTAWDYMRFAQMLLNRGELDGARILGRKTLELMHTNHTPAHLLPYEIGGIPNPGYGFGLGSRVLLNAAETAVLGSVGEFGWAGAAKTYYWVDPQEELVGLFMSQFMMSVDQPNLDFRVLAYQALVD